MRKQITQRELRNDSGAVMRAVDAGVSFLVTRNGIPVGELVPVRRPGFVPKAYVLERFERSTGVDLGRLRDDLDALASQTATRHE